MANLRLEIKQFECMDSDNERSDSLITNFDENELEESSVPINYCTPASSSAMLMNSYFDFVYAKALPGVKHKVIQMNCYGCLVDHPSEHQHDCIMSDLINERLTLNRFLL